MLIKAPFFGVCQSETVYIYFPLDLSLWFKHIEGSYWVWAEQAQNLAIFVNNTCVYFAPDLHAFQLHKL